VAIALGFVPLDVNVTLVRGGDFTSALMASVPWPVGTIIELRFFVRGSIIAAAVWPATIAAELASWDKAATAVQAVIDANPQQVRLHYAEADGTVIVWGRGFVHVA